MSSNKIFIGILVVIGLLWLLGATGMAWAESAAIMITMMPLVLLTAIGIDGLFITEPDVIFGTPTTLGYIVMVVVDLILICLVSKILSKLTNFGR